MTQMIPKLFKWVAVGLGVIAAAVLVVNPPMMFSQKEKADETEVIGNARRIGLALFEFETEYGTFPGPDTIAQVKANTGTELSLGTVSSNDFLRQLLAVNSDLKAKMFYIPAAGSGTGTKPKKVSGGLGKGECGFAYMGAANSAVGNAGRRLLVAPAIPGTQRFDPKLFNGKAIVLKMDNSVTSMDIGKDGKIMLDGRDMLDPGHPIWGGKGVTVAWPE